jgi:hypothetical protein
MLTNAVIAGTRPREKPFKLADGGGRYLLVTPAGSRWWRLRFRVRGKEQMLSLGIFPEVSLKEARERRDQARRDLAKGIDPTAKRCTEKLASGDTFEAIAREWFERFSPNWLAHSERDGVRAASSAMVLSSAAFKTVSCRALAP